MEDVLYQEEVEKYRAVRSALKSISGDDKVSAARRPELPVQTRSTIAEQLERLRIEADITQMKLCELVNLDPRTVQRHLAGATMPSSRIVYRYAKLFSMLLKRQVVISKLP
jgi:DNA-binding XRE family transcriptional regulator